MKVALVLCFREWVASETLPAEKEIEILALSLTLAGSVFLSLLEAMLAE
ncbi:hypothetical protein [Hafnia alvei]|nr:hypothetical protein [Hafnia alvei]